MTRTARLSMFVLLLSGCASSTRSSRDAGTTGLDGAVSSEDGGLEGDAGNSPSDGGPAADPDGGPVATTPFCRVGCSAPADCATPTVPLYDAAHYACEDGTCRWTGCQADVECQASLGPTYACRPVLGLMQCVQVCATTSTCGAGTPAFDADNYACTGGVCEYAGCRSDAECQGTFMSTRYVCRRVPRPGTGLALPSAAMNCVLGCTGAADCATASGAFDADNYACLEGACVYTGCRGDAECQSAFANPRYVCR